MTTSAQVIEHQADMTAIQTIAVAELLREAGDLAGMDPDAAASMLRELVADLLSVYGDEAAVEAADFYDELREAAVTAAVAAFAAQLAPDLSPDDVQEALSWPLAPLFGNPVDFAAALNRTAGVLGGMVGMMGQNTIAGSAAADPAGTRYARHASANACAFCRLMATRGATFRTKESALYVVGEIDPRSGGTRRGPRGTQPIGEKYHDFCKCIVVPVFPGDELEEAPYVADWRDDYEAAAKAAGGSKRANLADILAHMREASGAR